LHAGARVKKGSRVRLTVEKNRLVIEPVEKTKITLASLLAGVTPENIHPETDCGKPMGREIW
jgi:antitoxin MazE